MPQSDVLGKDKLLRWVVRLAAVGLAAYVLALLMLVLFQRRLMYFPGPNPGPAVAFGLPHAQTLDLQTSDGERIVAWYQPATAAKPLFLYFHGNGGTLAACATILRRLAEDGSGFFAIDYRGFGGSTGSPTEPGLLLDGEAAYRKVRDLGYGADRVIAVGESIGTGVAIALAADNPVRAVVLDSAFSSAADVAAAEYWVFPVRWLMLDQYKSRARIRRITAPKLFLHGANDTIVPIALDRKLFDAALPPKTFVELPGRNHAVLFDPSVPDRIRAWIAALPPSPPSR